MPKIKFSGYVEIDEIPDDRGTVDNWLARAIEDAVLEAEELESGTEHLSLLHIKWSLDA